MFLTSIYRYFYPIDHTKQSFESIAYLPIVEIQPTDNIYTICLNKKDKKKIREIYLNHYDPKERKHYDCKCCLSTLYEVSSLFLSPYGYPTKDQLKWIIDESKLGEYSITLSIIRDYILSTYSVFEFIPFFSINKRKVIGSPQSHFKDRKEKHFYITLPKHVSSKTSGAINVIYINPNILKKLSHRNH